MSDIVKTPETLPSFIEVFDLGLSLNLKLIYAITLIYGIETVLKVRRLLRKRWWHFQ